MKKQSRLRKPLSLLMAVAITLSMAGVTNFVSLQVSAAGEDIWDGTTDTSWYDEANIQPSYDITTAEQLAGFASLVNQGKTFSGCTINLLNDIDLDGKEWTPIGGSYLLTNVTFDGNGHVILNMSITSDIFLKGLFGWIKNCEVKNLGVEDAVIVSDSGEAGILVGDMIASSMYRCYTTGSISYAVGIADAAGGLVGQYYCDTANVDCYIKECYSSVDITSSKPGQYGGIIGWVSTYNTSSFTISDCYYSGEMIISDGDSVISGIAGLAVSIIGYGFPDLPKGSYTIENCYVSGTVENTVEPTSVLGIALIDGTVNNCYWNETLGIEGVMQMEWDKNTGDFTEGGGVTTNCIEKSLDDMKATAFSETLNNGRTEKVWGILSNAY